jgi:hypothetical protein
MTLKEFQIQLALNTLNAGAIHAIAEDPNTPVEVLEYLVVHGDSLRDYPFHRFSAIANKNLKLRLSN